MANAKITIDVQQWPEMIHSVRHLVYLALVAEAERSTPDVAAALLRVAARIDAGLVDAADHRLGGE